MVGAADHWDVEAVYTPLTSLRQPPYGHTRPTGGSCVICHIGNRLIGVAPTSGGGAADGNHRPHGYGQIAASHAAPPTTSPRNQQDAPPLRARGRSGGGGGGGGGGGRGWAQKAPLLPPILGGYRPCQPDVHRAGGAAHQPPSLMGGVCLIPVSAHLPDRPSVCARTAHAHARALCAVCCVRVCCVPEVSHARRLTHVMWPDICLVDVICPCGGSRRHRVCVCVCECVCVVAGGGGGAGLSGAEALAECHAAAQMTYHITSHRRRYLIPWWRWPGVTGRATVWLATCASYHGRWLCVDEKLLAA